MIVQPRVRGFICTTAHPVGCARVVEEQIERVKARGPSAGPTRVLVIGASTGYGLASRVAAAFGSGAGTIGVFFERPAEGKRTASAGWYNTAALERAARAAGLYARSVNGDAFSDETKARTIGLIRRELGPVDLVVYSLAAPRRTHPRTGQLLKSALKPIGAPYTEKSIDPETGRVAEVTFEPATDDEIAQTVAVMGGEDWELWMDALEAEEALAPGAVTVAYSYIGPSLTHPIYRHGTIGRAKSHLESTAQRLAARLGRHGGRALVSINKAVVTQSSAAIPVVSLYISLLFAVMKTKGLHEGCAEQMDRLLRDRLYVSGEIPVDSEGRVRLDDRELRPDIQEEVTARWREIRSENANVLADLRGYREDFLKLFGFAVPGVSYETDVDPAVGLEA
jgi:enoyl-[acyl-carrier protein] reductase/trans-2-enoyl-CoA reductase (NAD+)